MQPAPTAPEPAWLLHVERTLVLLQRGARIVEAALEPTEELVQVARALDGALRALYDAVDVRADRATAINAAQARMTSAAIALAQGGGDAVDVARVVHAASAELIAAEERLPRGAPPAPAAPAGEARATRLRASGDLPALHAVPRESVVTDVRVRVKKKSVPLPPPEPPLAPTTFEEAAAAAEAAKQRIADHMKAVRERGRPTADAPPPPAPELPPGFVGPLPRPVTERDFIGAWARECFEEVGMVGCQRTPLLGDSWRTSQTLERRMLAAVDAFAGLGAAAVRRLAPLAIEAPVRDPMRMFAAAMIGGCIEGRDALGAAERVLWHFGPGDPAVAASFVAAMKLAPHPAIPRLLRSLLAEEDPCCRAIAIEVLAHRGLAAPDELAGAACDPSARVAAIALPWLLALPGRSADEQGALARALEQDDPGLLEAAYRAMVVSADPRAAETLRAALGGPLAGRAAILLGILGDRGDAELLLERANASPSPDLCAALGWAGSLDAVPHLIGWLEQGDEAELPLAAASALERLLGAGLFAQVEVPPERVAEVDLPPEPDTGEPKPPPLAVLVSDPLDRPSEGSSDTLEMPTVEPEPWRRHWEERRPELDRSARHRRGQPYSPAVSLYELDAAVMTPGERRLLHGELTLRTGCLVRFDPDDLVAVQERALKAWEPIANRASDAPGAWAARRGAPARISRS